MASMPYRGRRRNRLQPPTAGHASTAPRGVVMPTYDQDAFLPAAVGSLLGQTLADWQLVVVDDGSPGDTAAALGAALDDPRVRLDRLNSNGGLGAALNRGLSLTSAP